jgi:hypothetical protein
MLGKKFGPARVLPILMASFGSFTLLTGIFSKKFSKIRTIVNTITVAATNFPGMLVLRIFLGMQSILIHFLSI